VVTAAALLLALACLVWPHRDVAAGPGVRGAVVGAVARCRLLLPRRRSGPTSWVADFAEVVAVGLDAGLDLGSAALTSARSPGVVEHAPWLSDRLRTSAGAGGGVARCLEPPVGAGEGERRDLALLATAWRLAEEVGAGASDVTAAAAEAVRARQAARERAVVLAAGPRASMWLLTTLPLLGPLAGALVGIGPGRLYGTPASRAVALVGLLLTGVGWWWSRTLLTRSRRPGRTAGAPR
jgi:tight adherence protein B